jgi:hypothetical protein
MERCQGIACLVRLLLKYRGIELHMYTIKSRLFRASLRERHTLRKKSKVSSMPILVSHPEGSGSRDQFCRLGSTE